MMNCLNLRKQSFRTLRFDFELTVFSNTDEENGNTVLRTHTLSQPVMNQFSHNREIDKDLAVFTAYRQ